MPRVTRGDRTFHPDELDPVTGEPLEAPEPTEELTPAQAAGRELEAMGATRAGAWWSFELAGETLKAQGAENALEEFTAALAELDESEIEEGSSDPAAVS